MKKLIINCEKATFLISKKEEDKLSLSERIDLFFHLSICKLCKQFESQTKYITQQIKHINTSTKLTDAEKAEMLAKLNKSKY